MTKVVNAFGNPNIEMIIDPIPYTKLRLLFIVYGFDRQYPSSRKGHRVKTMFRPSAFS